MLSTSPVQNLVFSYLSANSFIPAANIRLPAFELELLHAIDSIALLPLSVTRYQVIGMQPAWLNVLGKCTPEYELELIQAENFLENFLFDAELFWKTHTQGSLRSGQWVQIDSQGLEHPFQAIATFLQGHAVLILQHVAESYSEVGKILQSAREDVIRREKIEMLAYRDELTGLYNRRGFYLYAQAQMAMAKTNQWMVTVACVDLDGLKRVNDQYGHKFGDQLIFNAATLFKKVFRQLDVVGRVGGDEFLVLIVNMNGAETMSFNTRLTQIFADWNAQQDEAFKISFSIGMASDDQQIQSLEQLIERADAEMYQHKKSKSHPGKML